MGISFLLKIGMKKGRPPIKVKRPLAYTLLNFIYKASLPLLCHILLVSQCYLSIWEETNCDYYVVPHKDLIPEFASCGIPEEKLLPLGIPVRPAFARPASKEDVRRHLGLPENAPLFLVMSGSIGFGKVHLLAHELVSRLENGEQAVIICGNNKNGCVRSGCSSIRTQMYISSVLHATLRNIWPLPMCCLQSPGA